MILKTFSAELHKATTKLLGYQWLIIHMLSLGLVLSMKILKNSSQNLNTLAKFQHKYQKGPFLAEIGILNSFIVSLNICIKLQISTQKTILFTFKYDVNSDGNQEEFFGQKYLRLILQISNLLNLHSALELLSIGKLVHK